MKKLYGVTVAMTTPFRQDGTVDYASLEASTHMLIDKGVDCLYPCGTTGEMLRLTLQERMKVAETVILAAAGRVVVYIHCGAATEEDTITLVQHAQRSGADGAGVVTPQFFSLEHRELVGFFVRVAKSVSEDFPIYLYNIPQCSGNDIPVSAVKEIVAAAPNVVGIKYSWDVRILAYDPRMDHAAAENLQVTVCGTAEEVITECDILSLHFPATAENYHMFDQEKFASMKQGAYFINCARGTLMDLDALCAALKSGQLAGAAIDAFEMEPLPKDAEIFSCGNVVCLPHIGAETEDAYRNVSMCVAQDVIRVLRGEPPHCWANPW